MLVPGNLIVLPGHILSPVRMSDITSPLNLPPLVVADLAIGTIYPTDLIDLQTPTLGSGWFVAKSILGTIQIIEGGNPQPDPFSIVEVWSCGDTFLLSDLDPTLRPYWEAGAVPGVYVGTIRTGAGLPSPSVPSIEANVADSFVSSHLVAYRLARYNTQSGRFELAFRMASEIPQTIYTSEVTDTRLVGTDRAQFSVFNP